MIKNNFMELAIREAYLAFLNDEVPVGALIIKEGKIISRSGNLTRKTPDPTGHAEIRVIQKASQKLQTERLVGCDLFVTLEPCVMCAAAISFARIRRLYYATADPKAGAIEHGPRLFHQSYCHHKPEIYPGMCETNARTLLHNFFQIRRQNKRNIHNP